MNLASLTQQMYCGGCYELVIACNWELAKEISHIYSISLQIMDGLGENEPDLKPSVYPRFCEEIKKNLPSYTTHFTRVFQNKTFHVYKLAKHK